VTPNPLGYAFVIGQAVVVGTFAELQPVGLRDRLQSPECLGGPVMVSL
jgi:hypothetical protein